MYGQKGDPLMDKPMNRARFFELLANAGLSSDDIEDIRLAYWLTKEAHRVGPTRDSGERYFEHPRDVALILVERGHADRDTIITALLHDVLEDTYVEPRVIICLFGSDVLNSLTDLSKQIPIFDPANGTLTGYHKKTREEYYARLAQAPRRERLVKGADRLHNLGSMKESWPIERQKPKALETKIFILPFMWSADEALAREIETLVDQILSTT